MDELNLFVNLLVLSIVAIACMVLAVRFAKSTGHVLNFYTLALVNYMFIFPLSGLSHLSGWGLTRGYYDLLISGRESYVITATLATVLGFAGLIIGFGRSVPRFDDNRLLQKPWRNEIDRAIVVLLVLVMTPICLYSIQQIYAIRDSLALARIISLTGGSARYAFFAQWSVWVASFAAILILTLLPVRSKLLTLITLGCAAAVIFISVFWSGGRSVIIVMLMPLLIYAEPRLAGVKLPVFLGGGAAMVVLMAIISNIRSEAIVAGTGFDIGNWLDWEWGRYSIIGPAIDYVDMSGYLLGETFIGGFLWSMNAITSMIGIQIDTSGYMFSYNVHSRILFNSFEFIYVVPGLTAELYMNFGQIGVFLGYIVLGRAIAVTHRLLTTVSGSIDALLLAYFGVLLVFRTMPADSASIWSYLILIGMPLLIASAGSHVVSAISKPPPRHSRHPPLVHRPRVALKGTDASSRQGGRDLPY